MSTKTCIIGAGSSGIAIVKTFQEYGIDFDCFEKGSGVGGNWRYNNDNNMSSAYKSLHINTSRDLMAYSDFPMPRHYPDYPSHQQILDYFENYVDHFDIRKRITFKMGVEKVIRQEDGSYLVKTEDGREHNYAHLVVANGHHWDPRFPEPDFPGEFSGEILHSHFYKTPEAFKDKRVLVLGIGNSSVDITCELSRVAAKAFLATRSGAHVVPKYILGKPADANGKTFAALPIGVQRVIFNGILKLTRGNVKDYGLPKPKHKLFQEHPTVSQDLLSLIGHGRIHIKPNIKFYEGHTVTFDDGTQEEIDNIIYATGYKISFPFFEKDFVSAQNNKINLYHQAVHPDYEGLYFVGLIQPLGAIMPLAELQAKWIGGLISETIQRPPKNVMQTAISKYISTIKKRYIDRPRHTIQVDFWPYKNLIEKEMKKWKR